MDDRQDRARFEAALRDALSLLKSEKLLRASSYQELNSLELELDRARESNRNLLEKISLWQQKLGVDLHSQPDLPNLAEMLQVNQALQRQLLDETERRQALEGDIPWRVVKIYKSVRPYIPKFILRSAAWIIKRR